MIYLTEGIRRTETPTFIPLVSVIPCAMTAEESHKKLSLGYRQFIYNEQTLRGHEFHYTQFAEGSALPASIAEVRNGKGQP